MEYRSIADIYAVNESIHSKFRSTLESLTDDQAAAQPAGENWSVSQIVEHVSLVESGICRICSRLLAKAETNGQVNSGTIDLSEFMLKADKITDVKLEAPDTVHPVNGRSIAESIRVMEENGVALEELRPRFEQFDGGANTFPHPYLGELSALEWLVLAGGHKVRHLRQIKRLLENVR